MASRFGRLLLRKGKVVGLLGFGVLLWKTTENSSEGIAKGSFGDIATFHVSLTGTRRALRDVGTSVSMVADYYWTLRQPITEDERFILHQRNAEKLRQLFLKNGGVYIKFGQYMSTLLHLIPEPYVTAMLGMLQDAPHSSFSDVRETILNQFGKPVEEIFSSFDPVPVASASLAQVHMATTHDGRKVAVKVQHPGLRETMMADIAAVNTLVQLIHYLFPDFNYQWLVEEMQQNLPRELDFTLEARNCERCGENFKHRKDVAVPKIHWDLTREKVLTMEWIEGVVVSDVQGLKKLGLNPAQVSTILSEVFCEQIFIHGFIHCDPHPGNVYVQKMNGTNQPKLILLDHGLYQELPDHFRHVYSRLWRALIFTDIEEIKETSKLLDAGDLYPLLAAMLTHRPWREITKTRLDKLEKSGTPEEQQQIRAWALQYKKEISQILAQVPKQMLLLFKVGDCLRSVDHRLGATSSYLVTARYSTRAVNDFRRKEKWTFGKYIALFWDSIRLECKLALFRFQVWLLHLLDSLH